MKYKIKFAPGSFDEFDGTQEELDELVKSVMEFIESDEFAEILENAPEFDEIDEDEFEHIDFDKMSRTIH